jgi:hypothetical protein
MKGADMPTQEKYTASGAPVTVASPMVPLLCKYHGATNTRGSRITVERFEPGHRDPNRITVPYDSSLNRDARYSAAVQQYLKANGLSGTWIVSTIVDGAVAVWAGEILD